MSSAASRRICASATWWTCRTTSCPPSFLKPSLLAERSLRGACWRPRRCRGGTIPGPPPLYIKEAGRRGGGLSQTACDAQRFARDPGRFLGGQEDGGRRNVLGLADTAEWDLRLKLFAKVAFRHAGRVEAFGFHHARADGIHADVSRAQLFRQRSRHSIDGRLGGAVDREIRRGQGAGD